MISKIEMRKCSNCGKEFIQTTGGFICKITPAACPACGSTKSTKLK